ncbi:hypothetical protein CSOJ01_04135 [Colletotrichum sojae]|uniref:Uncharacterized protein n=1 Tax=Colletotrichum sojae TaxID=2175907 RepID=A0A8H6JJB1_9PEZI|nr:hypothetical protein CSOJ01_04135 [Colletotrichum sojae]
MSQATPRARHHENSPSRRRREGWWLAHSRSLIPEGALHQPTCAVKSALFVFRRLPQATSGDAEHSQDNCVAMDDTCLTTEFVEEVMVCRTKARGISHDESVSIGHGCDQDAATHPLVAALIGRGELGTRCEGASERISPAWMLAGNNSVPQARLGIGTNSVGKVTAASPPDGSRRNRASSIDDFWTPGTNRDATCRWWVVVLMVVAAPHQEIQQGGMPKATRHELRAAWPRRGNGVLVWGRFLLIGGSLPPGCSESAIFREGGSRQGEEKARRVPVLDNVRLIDRHLHESLQQQRLRAVRLVARGGEQVRAGMGHLATAPTGLGYRLFWTTAPLKQASQPFLAPTYRVLSGAGGASTDAVPQDLRRGEKDGEVKAEGEIVCCRGSGVSTGQEH